MNELIQLDKNLQLFQEAVPIWQMTITKRAVKVTWKLTGQKEIFTPLRLGLAHVCFGYSHNLIRIS